MINGYGKIFRGGKKVFEGFFKNGLMHGPGKYYFFNKNLFLGNFFKGMRDGPAKFIIKEENSGVAQIESIFKKNKLEIVTSITLKDNGNTNLNEIAEQKKIFEENNLIKIDEYNWKLKKHLTKKQKQNLNKLKDFENNIIESRSEPISTEDSDDSEVSKFSENLEQSHNSFSEDISDKYDSLEEIINSNNKNQCDTFDCSNSNWSPENVKNKDLCEHCKKNIEDFASDYQLKNEKKIIAKLLETVGNSNGKNNISEHFNNNSNLEKLIRQIRVETLNKTSNEELNKVKIKRLNKN